MIPIMNLTSLISIFLGPWLSAVAASALSTSSAKAKAVNAKRKSKKVYHSPKHLISMAENT